jgi:hypothetical protein
MKSVEQLFCEQRDSLTAKGVTAEAIAEAVKNCTSVEQRLSVLKEFDPNPVTRHSKKVFRKNGSAIHESDRTTDDLIHTAMRQRKASFREASLIVTGNDPGRNETFSKGFVESLKTKWKNSGAILSEAEIATLAAKGIEP